MIKPPPLILSRYLANQYVLGLLGFLFVLLSIVYLLDTIELLRRAVKRDDVEVPLTLVLQMGFFKLPDVTQVVLPFAVFFSAMLTFWSLNRRLELAVIRAAGLSVWQFLLPVLTTAFVCGLIYITIIHPVGAVLLGKFEQFENRYLGTQKNLVTVFQDGFWIRQKESAAGEVILNADKITLQDFSFHNVMGLAFSKSGELVSRLDAEHARLEPGFWIFEDVHITQDGTADQYRDEYKLATNLTRYEIEESFASPETVPFWQIPSFIRVLEATGFNSTRLKVHFHYLLSLPVMFAAMILLAAAVSLRPPRSRQTVLMVALGIALAVLVFFMSSYLQALGASQQIPPVLAAWTPALVTFLLGLTVILNTEDG
jgi:lipopolysaccharide export system permease protein